ncbi:MAG: peptide-N-glycosidase F-related protein [Myxococcota bacterium]
MDHKKEQVVLFDTIRHIFSNWLTEGYVETDEGVHPIALPPAADLQRYDRMEIVVKETCEPGSRFPVHFGVCPAWDVGHKITLCDDAESCVSSEKRQLYRYVTGYHSGVWLTEDVSHGLPFFEQGGQQFLRTDRRDFFGTIEFRFYDDGDVTDEDAIHEAVHLVDMGRAQFDPAHNDSIPSYRFTPPPGTARVVMDARVQGGGNQSGTGCAEFCSHEHRIDVNGTQWDTVFEMESVDACARRSRQGVTAGQFGTWFIDRGSWCPGGPVERWREDITEAVDLDGPNTITWTSLFEGDDWPPSGGLTATVWLAFYGGDGAPLIERLPVETCPNPPTVTVRDFSKDHPDFEPLKTAWAALDDGDAAKEAARGELTGVVAPTLEEVDGHLAPRLVWPENTLPYTTAASFDDWWRDAPSNQVVPLAAETGRRTRQDTWGYFRSNADASVEWPLIAPTAGFGAEGVENGHEGGTPVNTSFTVEVAGPFTHRAGLDLRIGSRADLWVFLDGALVYENAGFLGRGLDKNVLSLDAFDLVDGQTYDLRIFAVVGRGGESNPTLWLEHPACL